jgi:hypothetical protein
MDNCCQDKWEGQKQKNGLLNVFTGQHFDKCTTCQERRYQHVERTEELTPLPQCPELNQRVHVDLFGPMKPNSGKKIVLCMTDAFTKVHV